MKIQVRAPRKFLALLACVVLCLTSIGTECFHSFITSAESNAKDYITGSYVFDFDNSSELDKSYSYSKDYLPKVSRDEDKNILEMDSAGGKVFARLPFKLEAGKTYEYSISYRVASKGESTNDRTTVLKLISSGDNENINSLASAGKARSLSSIFSWKELNVSNEYTTVSGSFKTTDENVTDKFQYLTVHYETNKNFPQKVYIDKISIVVAESDITDSYEFDFDNKAELAQSYAYTKKQLPVVTKDGDKNVLEMDSDGGKVFARLPFKLEAGRTYEYSISYRVVSQGDSADSKTTVLKLVSAGKKDDINSLVSAGNARNLSSVLSWAGLNVGDQYAIASGSFKTTDENVTDKFQYLTLHYETNKNFPQKIYIDKITVKGEEISEVMPDVTGSYDFDFNKNAELAKSYAYSKDHLPKVSQDGDKNVLEMYSGGGKVFARLPFKLEAGKKYEYSISYRVVSQGDFADSKTTVLKLISSGEKDDINSLAASKRNLSTVLSWKALNVSEQYVTESGSFDATDSNVTGDYKYLTVHYETNKNFPQKIYIDKITVKAEETSEVMPDVTGSYDFDFNKNAELAKSYAYSKDYHPKVSQDGDKNVLEMDSAGGKVFARLPFKLEAGRTYEYSISYRIVSQGDSSDSKTTVLKLISSGKNEDINSLANAGKARSLSSVLSWTGLNIGDEYTTVNGSFDATESNVFGEYQYLTVQYETNKNFPQKIYIDKVTLKSQKAPEAMPDVTDSYEFDFNNPSELAKSYSYSNNYHPTVSQDGDKNVLELNSAGGKVFARLPFKLETGKAYKYSISYRIVSQGDSADSKTTVLKLISAGKKDDINSLAGSKRNLSTLLSWKAIQVSNEYTTVKGSFKASESNVFGEYQYLTVQYETNKNFAQTMYIDKIVIASYDDTPMADVTGKYDFEFNNDAELAYGYSYFDTNSPSVENDGSKKVLVINSVSNAYARLPFKLEPGKIYRYSISYRIASQGESDFDKTTLLALSSGKKTEKGSPIGNESTQKLTSIFNWEKLSVSENYKTISGDFTTTNENVTGENCYLTISYKTWKNYAQPLYIDKISVWEYTLPEARNTKDNPVNFEFDNIDDIDYVSNKNAEISTDPVTGKEALRIKATRSGVAVRLPYKMKANMAYRVVVNYRLDKTVDDKYYLQLVSGTREFEPNFWCDSEKKAYVIKEPIYWLNLKSSEEYTEIKSVIFIRSADVANNNGWLTLRLKCGIENNVNFYIDNVTVTEMTFSEAAHNVAIQDYNWSANPENTAKYVDWEKWLSKTAAVDLTDNTKNIGGKNDETKSENSNGSLSAGVIVGGVAAVIVIAAGVFLFILFRKRRKSRQTS